MAANSNSFFPAALQNINMLNTQSDMNRVQLYNTSTMNFSHNKKKGNGKTSEIIVVFNIVQLKMYVLSEITEKTCFIITLQFKKQFNKSMKHVVLSVSVL